MGILYCHIELFTQVLFTRPIYRVHEMHNFPTWLLICPQPQPSVITFIVQSFWSPNRCLQFSGVDFLWLSLFPTPVVIDSVRSCLACLDEPSIVPDFWDMAVQLPRSQWQLAKGELSAVIMESNHRWGVRCIWSFMRPGTNCNREFGVHLQEVCWSKSSLGEWNQIAHPVSGP